MSISTASIRANETFNAVRTFHECALSGTGIVVTASFGSNINKYVRRFNYSTFGDSSNEAINCAPTSDVEYGHPIDAQLLNVIASGSAFTVAYWARLGEWQYRPGNGARQSVFEIYKPGTGGYTYFYVGFIQSQSLEGFDWVIQRPAACGFSSEASDAQYTMHDEYGTPAYEYTYDHAWQHYAWVVDTGLPGTLYLNGQKKVFNAPGGLGWITPPGSTIPTSASYEFVTKIGRRFHGELSDLVFSSASLTDQQALDLYASSDNSTIPGLFCHYPLDEAPVLASRGDVNFTAQLEVSDAEAQAGLPGYVRFNSTSTKRQGGFVSPANRGLRDVIYDGPYTIQTWVSQSYISDNATRCLFSYAYSQGGISPSIPADKIGALRLIDLNSLHVSLNQGTYWSCLVSSGSGFGTTITGTFVDVSSSYNSWEFISLVVENDASDAFYCTASLYINASLAGKNVMRKQGTQQGLGSSDVYALNAGASCSFMVGTNYHMSFVNDSTVTPWNGLIGKMKIWSRARSADEIAADYASELGSYTNDV